MSIFQMQVCVTDHYDGLKSGSTGVGAEKALKT